MHSAVKQVCIFFLGAVSLVACCLVDEDLTDCGTDYTLDYELRLVTNMTTELQTQLSMESDIQVSNAIRSYLSGVFTDFAHDVDLSFYDVVGDSTLLHHESHIMDANQSSYTLYIPVRQYMHLATANMEENLLLTFQGGDRCHHARIVQEARDTIPSHPSGLFTARLPMDILEGEDQQFDVRLYMANCAAALLVDTLGSNIRDIKVFMSGFATSFDICDSVYHFSSTPPVVLSDPLELKDSVGLCYACVMFPSREPEETKTIIDTPDPFVSEESVNPLWDIIAHITMADSTITRTKLGVTLPLRAGQFKLIKGKVLDNGTVSPDDPSVAVSITLDWSPGLEIPVEF